MSPAAGPPDGPGNAAEARDYARRRRAAPFGPGDGGIIGELVGSRVRAWIAEVSADGPAGICGHPGPPAACLLHPTAGILCPGCLVDHLIDHELDDAQRCGACGEVAVASHQLSAIAGEPTTARAPDGTTRALPFGIVIVGLTVCSRCAELGRLEVNDPR